MSESTVYLISGTSRGIGLALLTALAAREGAVIYAGVRDASQTYASVEEVKKSAKGRVEIVELVSGDVEGNLAAVEQIKAKEGKLDVVIANAGIVAYHGPILSAPPTSFRDHFEVNTLGPLILAQAAYPLLSSTGKLVVVSSRVGSIGMLLPTDTSPYGFSKCGLNYLIAKLNQEEAPTAFVINPGWLRTDMGSESAKAQGLADAPTAVEEALPGILKLVDDSTKSTHGGRFFDFGGEELPW